MARGTTLVKLLNDLRAECGLSLSPAHNPQNRDTQIALLQRTQDMLWSDFAWPHLRVDRFLDLSAGQRYYAMPADIDIERIERIEARFDSRYCELGWGIGAEQYAVHDSDLDARAWPPRRAKIVEDEKLEIWPIPDTDVDEATLDGKLKIVGIRNLSPLVAESDRADLDDRLIVLFASAELLARTGAKDAQVKQDKATRHYQKLRGGLMPRKKFSMFGVTDRHDDRRCCRPIAVYRTPGST